MVGDNIVYGFSRGNKKISKSKQVSNIGQHIVSFLLAKTPTNIYCKIQFIARKRPLLSKPIVPSWKDFYI